MQPADVLGRIRSELKRKNIRQATVAEKLGISQQGVSARLSGRTTLTVPELCAIAELVGIAPDQLLAA